MRLCVDIGNSTVAMAVFNSDGNLICFFKIDDYEFDKGRVGDFIKKEFENMSILLSDVKRIYIASVVPRITGLFIPTVTVLFVGARIVHIQKGCSSLLSKEINPELGEDIYANLVSARSRHPDKNCIVFDFGTACTLSVCSSSGNLLGVSITTGIRFSLDSLRSGAAQLGGISFSDVVVEPGLSTDSAVTSGIFLSASGFVEKGVAVCKSKFGLDFYIIAAGGWSKIVSGFTDMIDEVNVYNTVYGIFVCGEEMCDGRTICSLH